VNPLGRATFKQLRDLGGRHGRLRSNQQVNMVFNPTEAMRLHVIAARDSAEK
jgi:hypothetical protein